MLISRFILVAAIGYLLGSIPFGAMLAKRRAKIDLRQYGSGKTGATNVMRTVGNKTGVAVAALDVSKGAIAVILAGLIIGNSYLVVGDFSAGRLIAQIIAALAAVAGHIKPVFLKFQGGRGVATYFGALAALCPPAAIFGGEMLVVSAGLSRYASLGSIAGTVSTYAILVPFTIVNGWPVEYLVYVSTGTTIVFITHRGNIARLVSGKERKLGDTAERRGPSPPV